MWRASIGILFVISMSHAHAATICDLPLSGRAFNSTDNRQIANFYNHVRNDMCKEHWTSQNDFQQSASNSGISVGIASVTFGFSGGGSSLGGNYSATYDKYCHMTDKQYISETAKSTITIDSTQALLAWKECIKSGLFVEVKEGPYFDYFDVIMTHRGDGGSAYNIYEINKEDAITCKVGNTPLNPSRMNPHKVDEAVSNFRCIKPSNRSTTMALNTSAGGVTIEAVGTALSEAELRELQRNVQKLTEGLHANDQDNIALHDQLNELRDEVKDIGSGRLLAIAAVSNRQMTTSSSGVSFDYGTGRVSFPNPKSLKYVPIVSKLPMEPESPVYVTQTIFVKSIGPNYVVLSDGALDPSGKVFPADNFTLAIIAFQQ